MPLEGFVIRKARKEDRKNLSDIAKLSFTGIYSYFAVRSIQSDRRILVVETNDGPVGFIILRLINLMRTRIGYIYWAAIHPDFRRKGLATKLLNAALDRFRNEKSNIVYASVEEDNQASQELFEKNGFVIISRKEIWKTYGIRSIAFYFKLLIAPHEIIYMRKLD